MMYVRSLTPVPAAHPAGGRPSPPQRAWRLVAMLVVAVAVTAPPPLIAGFDDTVIVEVGPQVITAREIIDAAERLYLQETSGDELADRLRLIEPLIQAKLLVVEAEALHLETPVMRRNLHKFENDFLINELEKAEISEKIVIDESLIEQSVALQKITLYLRHIMVADRDEAERILAEIRAGADFAAMAREHSLDRRSAEQGGQLPPLVWGQEDATFLGLAYSLKDGEIGGPVETRSGWHIVARDSSRVREVDEELLREQAEKALRQGEFSRRQLAFLTEMKERLHFTVDDSVVAVFAGRIRQWNDAGNPDMTGIDGSVDTYGFTDDEHHLALFTYDGGAFTIDDYVLYMSGSTLPIAKQRETADRVRRDLVQYFRHFAYADVARQRGYLEATGFDREVRRQYEKGMIAAYEARYIKPDTLPSEEELVDYFATHRQRYQQPSTVRVTEVTLADEPAAELVARALLGGMAVEDAIAMAPSGAGDGSVAQVAEGVAIDENAAEYAAVAHLGAGEVAELAAPEPGARRLAVVEAVEPRRPLAFEEAREAVRDDVLNALIEKRYAQVIEGLRAKYPVVVDEAALLELPLGSLSDHPDHGD